MGMTGRHRAVAPFRPNDGVNPPGRVTSYASRELSVKVYGTALLLVIGVLAAWAHHSLSTVRPAPPTIPAASPASDPAGPPTSSLMRVQLRAWFTQAEPSINALFTARHEIASAAANDDIVGTGTTCERAEGAVVGLEQYLPSPDPALNPALQQVITGYHVGLRYCIAGVQHHDANDLGQAAAYIRQANADLHAAIAILDHDLPTSESPDANVLSV